MSRLIPAAETKKWVISETSNLSVNGTTNINKFTCDIPNYGKTDTLTLIKGKNDKDLVLSGSVELKIQSFDCHNSMMTHDLRKTLKASTFPVLKINFLSLSKLPNLTMQPELITGLVDIEIAGVRKRFDVSYQISTDAQKGIHLVGTRDVNFSDFNLIPPRKLGGMIKTNDKLNVSFHLKIKAEN
ncbi:YceI family protein [Mucilaginibacter sp. UR6-11]|uniref:YceI family protein n=1 Tax=Mucilaginibacter sp. UR6-11 TaxID=1435644 RepID=UPI001E6020E8|nr:YceI family protein [Mucilaginibacter sp. UR6-11]